MLFPILKNEKIIQSGDKTRFDASNSFASEGETITVMTLQIGLGTPVDILSI